MRKVVVHPVKPAGERRAEIIAASQAETGINEEMIARVVRNFYERVQTDSLLAPIFAARVVDWEPHLQRMIDFWSSVMLMTGRYHGQPMHKHQILPIDARHFDRWLTLFELTVRDVCPSKAADCFMERARSIAESLELGVAVAHKVLLRRGERFHRFADE